jgi:hypothetical protein
MEKMQFIFFVPPNEELEGTLHPPKFGCTPKREGKREHVPPDEKTLHNNFVYLNIEFFSKCGKKLPLLNTIHI